jgi:3-methylcrotonyl-CoA carboxylase alpha subunit
MFKVALQPLGSGESLEITLERTAGDRAEGFHAEVNGRRLEVEVETLQPGEGWLRIAGRVYPYVAQRCGREIHLWFQGRTWSMQVMDRAPQRATANVNAAARQSAITAPMPGTVLKVEVAEGDAFEAHQPLIVMESMKMEMTLSAPHAGRIRTLECKPGQLVEMGAVLAQLDDRQNDELA